ncbi:hypothetical protein GCM10027519_47560 [Kineococcus endophyticus]
MQRELERVSQNVALTARLVSEHEAARQKVKIRQRWLFSTYCALSLSGGVLFGSVVSLALFPAAVVPAVGGLLAFLLALAAYVVLAVLSWPTQARRSSELRISSAAAAGRCSNAVAEGMDLTWRRRVADGLAATAEDFYKRHRRRWLAPASGTPLNITTIRLGRVCARSIRSMIERTLTTDDVAELRDDLWRLHLRVMAHDFAGVMALHHEGVTERPRGNGELISWRQVLVAVPVIITTAVAVFNLVWGTDTSLSDLIDGSRAAPTPQPSTTVD